jgi:hypothetical protein
MVAKNCQATIRYWGVFYEKFADVNSKVNFFSLGSDESCSAPVFYTQS